MFCRLILQTLTLDLFQVVFQQLHLLMTAYWSSRVVLQMTSYNLVSKPAVFSTRVGRCGFMREKIRLGTRYRFLWHRGMPKILLVGMVTLGSCTHGLLARTFALGV